MSDKTSEKNKFTFDAHFNYTLGSTDGAVPCGATLYQYEEQTKLVRVKKYIPINGVFHPASYEWVFEGVPEWVASERIKDTTDARLARNVKYRCWLKQGALNRFLPRD